MNPGDHPQIDAWIKPVGELREIYEIPDEDLISGDFFKSYKKPFEAYEYLERGEIPPSEIVLDEVEYTEPAGIDSTPITVIGLVLAGIVAVIVRWRSKR